VPHSPSPETVRRNFRIDLFAGVCSGIFASVLIAFMPVVVRRMGGTTFDVALVVAAPFIGHLLSPIGIYLLSGLRPVGVVAGVVVLSRSIFLAGVLVATTPLLLSLTTVAFWLIAITNIAAYTTVMAAIYPDRERAQAMGKVRVGVAVAAVISAAVAGLLIDVVPATWVFAAAAALSMPGAFAFFWIRDDAHVSAGRARLGLHTVRDIWMDAPYRDLLFANTVYGLGNLMNGTIIPLMLVDHLDAPNAFIGALAAIASVTSVFGYLVWGRLIDRGSSLRLSAWNASFLILLPLTYLLAPNYWWLLPVAVVQGIVNSGFEITFHTNIVQAAPRGRVLDYATAQSFVLGVRGTIAPFLASALLELMDVSRVLMIVITLMVAGVVLYFRAVRAFAAPTRVTAVEPAPAT
jgi:MFS transporter, DHA1 family, staphyloferrin B biosynthesis exporter